MLAEWLRKFIELNTFNPEGSISKEKADVMVALGRVALVAEVNDVRNEDVDVNGVVAGVAEALDALEQAAK